MKEELKEQFKSLDEVLEKHKIEVNKALEAAYRDGAVDGYYAKEESNKGLIDNLWLESDTKKDIDNQTLSQS